VSLDPVRRNEAKIESVDARLLVVPLPPAMTYFGYQSINVPFVTIRDTDGIEATGFTYTLDAGANIVCRMVEEVVAPALVGTFPDEWQSTRSSLLSSTRRLGATAFVAALSAVDIAVWDLRGLRENRPLYALLGGSTKDVPFYGSGRSGDRMTTDELVRHSQEYLGDGFDAVKIGIGVGEPARDVARVRAVRDAIGEGHRLMVDAAERLSVADALWIGKRLEEFDLYWFEEPLLAEDVQGYSMLADRLSIPIATGEHFQQSSTFERYFRETGVAIYQPDAALGGGITEMLTVAELARANHRPLAWHSLADLHVHIASCAPTTRYIEDFPILDRVIADPLRPSGGVAVAPSRPGHGIVWDRDAVEAYGRPG
jgi:L-alanine-DL-glutamate epimerase-like enolase superfamily enzyme